MESTNLDVRAHFKVLLLHYLVTFVHDKVLQLGQIQVFRLHQGKKPSRSSYDNLRTAGPEKVLVFYDCTTSDENPDFKFRQESNDPLVFLPREF